MDFARTRTNSGICVLLWESSATTLRMRWSVGRSWELDVAKVGLKAELWVGGVLWDYILEGLTGRKL